MRIDVPNPVDDKDIRRLDDRIDSVSREAQLRLEAVLARLEGQFGRIADQTAAMRQELSAQRDDARAQRIELNEAIASSVAVTRSWAMRIIGSIFVVAAIGIAVDIGLRQVWVVGVQVGQAASVASTPASTQPPSKP